MRQYYLVLILWVVIAAGAIVVALLI